MPRKNNLRCAVIGAGNMGMNHIRIYSRLPRVDLVAIAEPNVKVTTTLSKKFKVRAYADYEQMLKSEKLDVVSVCVPTSLHYTIAKKCIQSNINLLLEKPIATALHEAEDLIRLAKKHKIAFLVGHVERFNPAVIKVRELIKSGKIGKIITVIARRVGGFPYQIRDANIMVDLAIHDIDIFNFILEELPQVVYVSKKRIHIKQREDSVEYFLKYKFATGFVQTNWFTPVKIRKLNITGTKGYIEMDYITQKVEFYKSNYNKFKKGYQGFTDYVLRFGKPDKVEIPVRKKEPLEEELRFFTGAVAQGAKMSPKFALDALKIALY